MSKYHKRVGQCLAAWFVLCLVRLLPALEARDLLDKGLLWLLRLAQRIPYDSDQRLQLRQLYEIIRSNHPCVRNIRRLVAQLNPKYLRNLVRNLWVPCWLHGEVRQCFRDQEGFEPPLLAVISPLKECNLQCVGCYADASREKQPQRLDFETMDKIVAELRTYGTPFIVFTGGEPTHPLIWPDIKRICEKYSEQAFMMYTNGTLLDDEKVRELGKLGNLSPAISLEGWEEQTDARRGKGVFARVVAAMDRLREAGALFGFSMTYTSVNFEASVDSELIDFLIEKGCTYGWYFMYVPVGKSPDINLVVTPGQRDKIREFTWRMLREKGLLIFDFWNSGHLSQGCIAGGRYLHINNRGDIEPCVFFKFATHNIHESTVLDALRSTLFRALREGQRKQAMPLTPCQFMDNPHCGKRAVELSGAKATEQDGEELFRSILPFLERFSKEYREKYAWPAWQQSPEYEYFRKLYADGHWLRPCKIGPTVFPEPRPEREAAAAETADSTERELEHVGAARRD